MTTSESIPTQTAGLETMPPPPPTAEMLADSTDAELLSLAAWGADSAFAELYGRYGRSLYNTALRSLANTEDAAEVLQETFLYAWTRAEKYDSSRAAVSTWLGMILRSRCIDRMRRREHQRKMKTSVEQQTQDTHCEPRGFDRVASRERNHTLGEAMERLPEAQKEVLELAFFRGLTHREIAAKVGVPIGTIKTRSVLAMRKLHLDLTGKPRQVPARVAQARPAQVRPA